jgi:hypothetical protein
LWALAKFSLFQQLAIYNNSARAGDRFEQYCEHGNFADPVGRKIGIPSM